MAAWVYDQSNGIVFSLFSTTKIKFSNVLYPVYRSVELKEEYYKKTGP